MKRVIIVRIFGGLGNQLFTYCAARRLALVNNAELVIDHVSGFSYDTQYKRHYQLDHFAIPCRKATPAERFEPFGRIRRKLLREWNQRLPFDQRSYLVQEGVDFDPRLLDLRPKNSLYLEGYWQSEGYFKDVERRIRQDLQFIPPLDAANLAFSDYIRERPAVAVHVRYFDRLSDSVSATGNNAHADYYADAVAALEAKVSGAHYFIFSDCPEFTRSLIPIQDDRVTVVSHNLGDEDAYADLWLMTQCQHFIIANSTFSWWGAWLARNPRKIIIAPGFKLSGTDGGVASWGFKGLLPPGWQKL